MAPTLEAIPLRPGGAAVAVLAAGAHTAAVISEHGRLLDSLELPVGLLSWQSVRLDIKGFRVQRAAVSTHAGRHGAADGEPAVGFEQLKVCTSSLQPDTSG